MAKLEDLQREVSEVNTKVTLIVDRVTVAITTLQGASARIAALKAEIEALKAAGLTPTPEQLDVIVAGLDASEATLQSAADTLGGAIIANDPNA